MADRIPILKEAISGPGSKTIYVEDTDFESALKESLGKAIDKEILSLEIQFPKKIKKLRLVREYLSQQVYNIQNHFKYNDTQ